MEIKGPHSAPESKVPPTVSGLTLHSLSTVSRARGWSVPVCALDVGSRNLVGCITWLPPDPGKALCLILSHLILNGDPISTASGLSASPAAPAYCFWVSKRGVWAGTPIPHSKARTWPEPGGRYRPALLQSLPWSLRCSPGSPSSYS